MTAALRATTPPSSMGPPGFEVEVLDQPEIAPDCALYSVFRGSAIRIDLKNKVKKGEERDPDKDQQFKDLNIKMQHVWAKAKEMVETRDKVAENLRVNLSESCVSYTDQQGNIQYLGLDQCDPEFRTLLREMQELGKEIFQLTYPDDFQSSAMGNIHRGPAFEIVSKHWHNALVKSEKEYLTSPHHFEALCTHLAQGKTPADALTAQREAFNAIMAGAVFRQSFLADVARQRAECQELVDDPTFTAKPQAYRSAVEETLRNLEKLQGMLVGAKYDAVFGALGIWGNTPPDDVNNPAVLGPKTEQISEFMRGNLERLHPGEDGRNRLTRWAARMGDLIHGRQHEPQILPRTYVSAYAEQTADQIQPTREAQIKRAEENGRDFVAPSAERLIVHNTMHATRTPDATTNAHAAKSLDAMGIRFPVIPAIPGGPARLNVQGNLVAALEHARFRAAVARDHANTYYSSSGDDPKQWCNTVIENKFIETTARFVPGAWPIPQPLPVPPPPPPPPPVASGSIPGGAASALAAAAVAGGTRVLGAARAAAQATRGVVGRASLLYAGASGQDATILGNQVGAGASRQDAARALRDAGEIREGVAAITAAGADPLLSAEARAAVAARHAADAEDAEDEEAEGID